MSKLGCIRDRFDEREEEKIMADGGFLIKFDGKEIKRCYAVSFDYDMHEYIINEKEKRELPHEVKSITIEIERG